jgi:hypothetical protein
MSFYNIIYLFYKRVKRFFKKCLCKCCFIKKESQIVPDTTPPKIIKRSVKFGCQICHNIIISSKMKCKHRFCELCVITMVLPFKINRNCQICEMLIANELEMSKTIILQV